MPGALSDYGINDDFMKNLGKALQPGSSAIFILARRFTPDKFAEEIARYGGTLLHTSLTRDAEARLQQALSGQHEPNFQPRTAPQSTPDATMTSDGNPNPGLAH